MLRMLLSKVVLPLVMAQPSSVLKIVVGDALDAHSLAPTSQWPAGTCRVMTFAIVFLTGTIPFFADKILTEVALGAAPRAGVAVTAANRPPTPTTVAAAVQR